MEKLNKNEIDILSKITNIEKIKDGAYNIRKNGKLHEKYITENINIVSKKDKEGIDIYVSGKTRNESVYIPVIVSNGGINDLVYNDFFVEDNANVTIYAGCGIHNCSENISEHSGIHRFYIGKNAKVKYIENHYGKGSGNKILNPTTEAFLEKDSIFEMYTNQIEGVNSSIRKTEASLKENSTLIIRENIMSHNDQSVKTYYNITLDGENSSCHLISRSVAKDDSVQEYYSKLVGNCKSYAHSECDAILTDNGKVMASPQICANSSLSILVHEATIGKIAGEQLDKLMTLGLNEKEAEEVIIKGFLK